MTIQVQIDDRIRIVSSVMLLTDFVHENEECGKPHPLKTRTIECLAGSVGHPCAVAARKLATRHYMDVFHAYAILLPQKAWAACTADGMRPAKHPLMGEAFNDFVDANFESLLYQLYVDAEIQTLWDDTEADWETAREDCADIVRTSRLDEFIDLLFGKSDYSLVLIPSPLDPPTFGFGKNDGHTSYAILGAPKTSDDRNPSGRYAAHKEMTADIAFHEFAHTLWSASRKAYPAILDETAVLQDTMEYRGNFPNNYGTWDIQLDEIVIRAATAHYVAHRDGDPKAQAFLDREKSWYGISLIDTVFLSLGRYLEARKRGEYNSLSEFLPVLSEMMRTER